jgi:hypothetical protein
MNAKEVPMNKFFTVALAVASGFAGSVLTRYVAPPVSFAQNQTPKATAEVRAESFILVDSMDHPIATLEAETRRNGPYAPPRVVLRDANGLVFWTAGGTAVHPLSLH